MITKEPKTKSKEKRKRESESNYSSKSQEEDKPRTSASSLRRVFKSMNPAYKITNLTHMKATILEIPIMEKALAQMVLT
jgi:hypothetical protein